MNLMHSHLPTCLSMYFVLVTGALLTTGGVGHERIRKRRTHYLEDLKTVRYFIYISFFKNV